MTDRPSEPASPACSAHLADDTYMGFATAAEIDSFLRQLADDERAGRPWAENLRRMLPRLRDDRLHRRLAAKLQAHEAGESRT